MASKFTNFLRQLFARKGEDATDRESEGAVDYKGYTIRPNPRREGAQWLTSGVITKQFADEVKEHRFIRADAHGSKDAAADFSITKAKQIIDERGDKLFEGG